MVQFLSDEKVETPTGGEFTPSGIISSWHGLMVYTFSSQTPLDKEFADKANAYNLRSGWHWYYFKDEALAREAVETADTQFKTANLIWHFETEKKNVLNFGPEAQAAFGDSISYSVQVKSLGSTKYRHEYHMISLPTAVDAYARNLGFDTPGFDLSELIGDNPLVGTDPFHFEMIGNPDVRDESDPQHYTNSVLWKRRAALWEALGETNAKAFRMIGDGTKFDTTSEKLSQALAIANRVWRSSVWLKLVNITDPRVGAQLSIPAIFDIYENKEEAQAAVQTDRAETGNIQRVPAQASATSTPPVPEAWKEAVADWMIYFADFRKENPSLNPVVIGKATSQLGVTEEEIRTWYSV